MHANTMTRHYGALTAEERFRLIAAAGAHGDRAEQDRLVNAGERITCSTPGHTPYAQAFTELDWVIFVELLEAAADYLEGFNEAVHENESEEGALRRRDRGWRDRSRHGV
jgi:hypothetical protein